MRLRYCVLRKDKTVRPGFIDIDRINYREKIGTVIGVEFDKLAPYVFVGPKGQILYWEVDYDDLEELKGKTLILKNY